MFRWTDQCEFGHDANRKIDGYWAVGQNAYTSSGSSYNSSSVARRAVQAWYSEVQYWPSSSVGSFQSTSINGNAVGHFTQIIWADTTHIGCGYVMFQEGTNWKKVSKI